MSGLLASGIRWPDFSERPPFGGPFGHFSRHPDTPLLPLSTRHRLPQPRLFDGVLAFLDVLLRFAPLIVEQCHPLGRTAQVGDDETDAGIQVVGILPAPPAFSIPAAKLVALRRVYAVQAYPLASNLYRVAIDHAGLAGDVGPGERRQEYHQREGDQVSNHGYIFCRL